MRTARSSWLPRLVLAVVAAGTSAAGSLADILEAETPYRLEVDLAASAGGVLQVFYDRGAGVTPVESATIPIAPTPAPQTYRLPLPVGRFRLLRLDPNDRPGRYVITRLRIVDGTGRAVHVIPVDRLQAAHQVRLEQDTGGIAIVTTPQANDPQVVYREPFVLAQQPLHLSRAAGWGAAAGGCAFLLAAWLDRRRAIAVVCRAVAAAISRRPAAAVAGAGLAAALAATYPLVLGRSLVSPSIGPTHLLYDQPPFAFGSDDRDIENARGTDVGAMMWAILPYTAVQREAIAAGQWPLWNRYNGIGEPLWGQGQTFALDPVHAASLLIPDPALAMDVRFVTARAVFAIGAGLSVLAVTGHTAAACLVALMAPFVGHFTARFNHPAYFSIVYVPWILLAYAGLDRAVTLGQRARSAAWLALATWLQLVGSTPKEGVVALAGAHLAGVLGLLASREPWAQRWGRLDAAAVAGIVALLLGTPHWLVFLDTLGRAYTYYDQPAAYLAGWTQLVAYGLGAVTMGHPQTGVHPLAIAAAACALVYPVRLMRCGMGVGAAIAAAALAGVACGAVPTTVLLRLPLLANLHQVGLSFLSATIGPLLLLAGVGLSAVIDAGRTGVSIRLTLVICFGFVVAALVATSTVMTTASLLAAAAITGTSLTLAVLAAPSAASSVLGVTVAGCLAVCAGGLHTATGREGLDALLIQPRPRADLDAPSPAIAAIRSRGGMEPFRVAPVEGVLFPGTQALWRLEGIGGPDAVRLPAVESLLDAAGVERSPWGWLTILGPVQPISLRRLLDMLNVRFLVARVDRAPEGLAPLPMNGEDLVRAFERPAPWPRAFFTAGIQRHQGVADFVRRLAEADGPFSSVDVQDVSALAHVGNLPTTGLVVPAGEYRLTPNTTTFRVKTTDAGVAVLAEAFVDTDFVATLNGSPVPYFRVNHAFKAVRIPAAGVWEVAFEYRPARWRLAWLAAAAGVLLWLVLVLADPLLKRRWGDASPS